jgi:hypothetical protein
MYAPRGRRILKRLELVEDCVRRAGIASKKRNPESTNAMAHIWFARFVAKAGGVLRSHFLIFAAALALLFWLFAGELSVTEAWRMAVCGAGHSAICHRHPIELGFVGFPRLTQTNGWTTVHPHRCHDLTQLCRSISANAR